jgi:hypothetical protein
MESGNDNSQGDTHMYLDLRLDINIIFSISAPESKIYLFQGVKRSIIKGIQALQACPL